MDNSPYHAMTVKTGKGYPYKWEEWIQQANAEALPGAVSFYNTRMKRCSDLLHFHS